MDYELIKLNIYSENITNELKKIHNNDNYYALKEYINDLNNQLQKLKELKYNNEINQTNINNYKNKPSSHKINFQDFLQYNESLLLSNRTWSRLRFQNKINKISQYITNLKYKHNINSIEEEYNKKNIYNKIIELIENKNLFKKKNIFKYNIEKQILEDIKCIQYDENDNIYKIFE